MFETSAADKLLIDSLPPISLMLLRRRFTEEWDPLLRYVINSTIKNVLSFLRCWSPKWNLLHQQTKLQTIHHPQLWRNYEKYLLQNRIFCEKRYIVGMNKKCAQLYVIQLFDVKSRSQCLRLHQQTSCCWSTILIFDRVTKNTQLSVEFLVKKFHICQD